jgi:transcriptional regulator with XRE-family HTH domain
MSETFSKWLTDKYLDWQKASGSRRTLDEYAKLLRVGQSTISEWMNGRYNPRSAKHIDLLRAQYGDEVYDILGLPRPAAEPDVLPGAYIEELHAIRNEINAEIKRQNVHPMSPEAEAIGIRIMAAHGWTLESKIKTAL